MCIRDRGSTVNVGRNPRFSLRFEPWAEISQRLRRILEGSGSYAQSRRVRRLGTEFNAGVNLENSIEFCDFEYSRQTCIHIHQFEVHSVFESVFAEL